MQPIHWNSQTPSSSMNLGKSHDDFFLLTGSHGFHERQVFHRNLFGCTSSFFFQELLPSLIFLFSDLLRDSETHSLGSGASNRSSRLSIGGPCSNSGRRSFSFSSPFPGASESTSCCSPGVGHFVAQGWSRSVRTSPSCASRFPA